MPHISHGQTDTDNHKEQPLDRLLPFGLPRRLLFFYFSYFLPKSEVDVPYGRAMQLVMTALKWFVSSPSDDFNECERRILTLQHSEVAVITAAITADTEQGQSAACSYCAAEQKEGSSLSST